MFYEKIVAPLLFMMEAEAAHNLALSILQWASANARILTHLGDHSQPTDSPLQQTLGRLRFPNPIGLAAGFDKNGVAVPALAALGFGFITVGTVTPRGGQTGSPKPRLFRDIGNQALWNRLGFNNQGADALERRLQEQPTTRVPLGISLGKAADTPLNAAADDYLYSLEHLYPYGDFFEVCISSPNTHQLRSLQSAEPLDALLGALVEKASEMAASTGADCRKPLWPKFAPDMAPEDRDRALAICQRHLNPDLDAIIMGNSTIDPSVNPAMDKGGYSGRPLFPKALAEAKSVHETLAAENRNSIALVGCGGIFDGDDAFTMLKEGGCQLVQLHSAFPYRGPLIARKIRQELLRAMARSGIQDIKGISQRRNGGQSNNPLLEELSGRLSHSQGPGQAG